MIWIPCIGDTGINGTIITGALVNLTCIGILVAWQDQSNPESQYSGPSNRNRNPLVFEYSAQIIDDQEPVLLTQGQLVTFDVIAAEFGPVATNVQLA